MWSALKRQPSVRMAFFIRAISRLFGGSADAAPRPSPVAANDKTSGVSKSVFHQ
jgi:hypothetical protein